MRTVLLFLLFPAFFSSSRGGWRQGSSLLLWSDEPGRNHRGCRKAFWRIYTPLVYVCLVTNGDLGMKGVCSEQGGFGLLCFEGFFNYISGEQEETSPPNPQSFLCHLALLKRRNNSMHVLLEDKITLFPGKSYLC